MRNNVFNTLYNGVLRNLKIKVSSEEVSERQHQISPLVGAMICIPCGPGNISIRAGAVFNADKSTKVDTELTLDGSLSGDVVVTQQARVGKKNVDSSSDSDSSDDSSSDSDTPDKSTKKRTPGRSKKTSKSSGAE